MSTRLFCSAVRYPFRLLTKLHTLFCRPPLVACPTTPCPHTSCRCPSAALSASPSCTELLACSLADAYLQRNGKHDKATATRPKRRTSYPTTKTQQNRGLKEIGLILSSKQRRELLRLADPDRSGSVDIKELTELFYDVEVEMAAATEVADEASAATGRRGLGPGGAMRHTISGDVGRPDLDGGAGGGGGGGRAGGSANERVERMLRRRASEKWG